MQRILHVIGKMDRAGAETMVMNLYRTIDRTEFQFDFITFTKEKGDFDDEIRQLGGRIISILPANPIKRMMALKNFLVENPVYQTIHCHTLFSNGFHLLAAKMAKMPFRVVHSHSTSDPSKGRITALLYHTISRKLIHNFATHFVSCGVSATRFLFPKQDNVLLLPNSIDIAFFAKTGNEEKNYLNLLFDLDVDCLKIIQIGRLHEVKNYFFSIAIAKELKNKGFNFKLFFVGQGHLSAAIASKIEVEGLQNEVVCMGLRSDIPQLMAGADVMVMPSLYEGFPVVMVEAQAVGLPSVISDSISAEVDLGVDLVEFVSLNATVNQWIEAIVDLKNRPRLDAENRILKLKAQSFDIETSVKQLEQLYSNFRTTNHDD